MFPLQEEGEGTEVQPGPKKEFFQCRRNVRQKGQKSDPKLFRWRKGLVLGGKNLADEEKRLRFFRPEESRVCSKGMNDLGKDTGRREGNKRREKKIFWPKGMCQTTVLGHQSYACVGEKRKRATSEKRTTTKNRSIEGEGASCAKHTRTKKSLKT